MEPTDLTIEILKSIRDEARSTNTRLEGLDRRVTATKIRLANELVAVAGAVRELRDTFREDRAVREHVDDHERRLAAIERRAG
jgi:hypothetical protein